MPMPMPSITAPGGGPGGPRSTMISSSGGGRRRGGKVSTRRVGGGESAFFFSVGVVAALQGQVGASATLVGGTPGVVSAVLAPSERLRTRSCSLCAVAARSLLG